MSTDLYGFELNRGNSVFPLVVVVEDMAVGDEIELALPTHDEGCADQTFEVFEALTPKVGDEMRGDRRGRVVVPSVDKTLNEEVLSGWQGHGAQL